MFQFDVIEILTSLIPFIMGFIHILLHLSRSIGPPDPFDGVTMPTHCDRIVWM